MILGVLGGVGSGKSTVTRMFIELGADSISADAIAHKVIEVEEIREEIRGWLGDGVFDPDGRVDRREVARRVFSDPEALARLEELLHPEIRRRMAERIEEFRASPGSDRRVLVLDVPLLAGTPLEDLCDETVYVDAPARLRRERTAERGWEPDEFERREAAQPSLEEKRRRATRHIDNSDSLESTRAQVQELYDRLVGGFEKERVTPGLEGRPSRGDRKGSGCR